MYKLGLIGSPLTHSFSEKHFIDMFKKKKINNFKYSLYPIDNLQELHKLIKKENLTGLNVTRPYKTSVIKYLDKIDIVAQKTKSVNTIFIDHINNQKIGFNTDMIGFHCTIKHIKIKKDSKVLILGSGSVSKTITYYFKENKTKYYIASRKPSNDMISYTSLKNKMQDFQLIINTTPLGQYPNIKNAPKIPYNEITKEHYCIDLIYNPKKTLFLNYCSLQGANIINGQKMLISQAEASWEIWNELIKKTNV